MKDILHQIDMPVSARYFIVFDAHINPGPLAKDMAGSNCKQCHVVHELRNNHWYTYVAVEYQQSFQAKYEWKNGVNLFKYISGPDARGVTTHYQPKLVIPLPEGEDEKWIAIVRRMGQLMKDESLCQYEEEKWEEMTRASKSADEVTIEVLPIKTIREASLLSRQQK